MKDTLRDPLNNDAQETEACLDNKPSDATSEDVEKKQGGGNQSLDHQKQGEDNQSPAEKNEPVKFTRRNSKKVHRPHVDFQPVRKKQNRAENNHSSKRPEIEIDFPTGIISSNYLTIHTTQAYSLLVGGGSNSINNANFKKLGKSVDGEKPKKEILNKRFNYAIFTFSMNAVKVSKACRNGNPFATMILCQLEKRIDQMNEALKQSSEFANNLIRDMENLYGINIQPIESKHPQNIPIVFKSNYANSLVKFIGGYDVFMRKFLSLRRADAFTFDTWREHKGILSTMYRGCLYPIFNLVDKKLLDITLIDYLEYLAGNKTENHLKVKRAIGLFGKIDDIYLDERTEPLLLDSIFVSSKVDANLSQENSATENND